MIRRRLLPRAGALAIATFCSLQNAHATSAILPSSAAVPIDQNVAIAVSPSRTTVWTNLNLLTGGLPVALVIPVPPGAALDHSSDAWFEALDDATAPRVFPPNGASYVCPGASPDPANDPFHVTTFQAPLSSIQPVESKVLPDVPAVVAWANTNGFIMSLATIAELEGKSGMRFFVERFKPQTASFFTSTLRITLPSSTSVLPLALTHAGSTDLRVTTWFIGTGRATLTGSSPLKLQMTDLKWIAGTQTSNYIAMRDDALVAAGSAATVTETSNHDALVKNISIANGKGSITGVVTSYFQRTAQYADGDADPSACILNAGVSLESTLDVTQSCPRADLGVVDGVPSCVETPNGSKVDPAKLRCGGRADDLAVALSDLRPSTTWITRMTMVVPKEASGQTWPITFTLAAPQVDPSETASSISFAGCNNAGSSSSSSSGSTGSGPTGAGSGSGGPWTTTGSGAGGVPTSDSYDPSYNQDMACGCVGAAVDPVLIDDTSYGGNGGAGGTDGTIGTGGLGGAGGDSSYYDTSSSDDCSGSTTDTSSSDTSSSDDCSGSTTDTTTDTSSSSDGIDCSGDTGGSGGSSGSGSGSGGTTDTTDTSSSDSSDCAVARAPRTKPHKRGPKASVMTLGLLAILAPLRRLRRPRRAKRTPQDKLASNRP